jgi:glucosamine-phosphate N-acetyltransferase
MKFYELYRDFVLTEDNGPNWSNLSVNMLQQVYNLQQLLSPRGSEEWLSFEDMSEQTQIIVGMDGDKVVCTGTLVTIEKLNGEIFGQIEDVVVHPDYRGKGFGILIVEELKKLAQYHYKIVLNCSKDNIPFYEKCGFKQAEVQMRLDI